MPISIKNDQTEDLARKLAERDSDHVHLEYLLTAPVTA